MMSYADEKTYLSLADKYGFKNVSSDPAEIRRNIALAQIKIDELTFGRIRQKGFENLTEFQQEMVSGAVCAQADHIAENGFDDGQSVESYSVLDISVSVGDSKSESGRLGVSALALSLLRQSGLMERLC